MFETGILDDKYVQRHHACVAYLRHTYQVRRLINKSFEKVANYLDSYFLYRPHRSQVLLDAHWVRQGDAKIMHCLVGNSELLPDQIKRLKKKPKLSDPYQFFLINLKKDFGKAFIRPETFGDKVFEVLIRQEVDFENHKAFSDKYYFYTEEENEARIRKLANQGFLDTIYRYDDLVIQIVGRRMMVKRLRRVTEADCHELATFAFSFIENAIKQQHS